MSKKGGTPQKPQKTQQPKISLFTKSEQTRNITTGSSSNTKNTPPKHKGDTTPPPRMTRAKLEDEENKQVEKDKEAAVNMPVEERRKRYKCGNRFVLLDDVETWKVYAKKIESGSATSPKKKKSSAAKGKTYEAKDDLNQKVSVWRGDITTLEIDAIVNAANESLMGGGGVDGAIHSAAGMKLKRECARLKGCLTGDAKITCGYDLPAKYVIHTVGPIGEGEKDLHSCYQESLKRMKENNLTSIAFPCISTGIYGYPNERAAPLAMKTVREFLENDEYGAKVERVIFCLFLKVDVDLYGEGMKKFFPLAADGPEENGAKSSKSTTSAETKEADRKETSMEVDDVKTVKTGKTKADSSQTARQNNENDVEMKDEKSEKPETPAKPDENMEEDKSKAEKKTEAEEETCEMKSDEDKKKAVVKSVATEDSCDMKSEEKVSATKGDNSDDGKGGNPNCEEGENPGNDKADDSKSDDKLAEPSLNAKGDGKSKKLPNEDKNFTAEETLETSL